MSKETKLEILKTLLVACVAGIITSSGLIITVGVNEKTEGVKIETKNKLITPSNIPNNTAGWVDICEVVLSENDVITIDKDTEIKAKPVFDMVLVLKDEKGLALYLPSEYHDHKFKKARYSAPSDVPFTSYHKINLSLQAIENACEDGSIDLLNEFTVKTVSMED